MIIVIFSIRFDVGFIGVMYMFGNQFVYFVTIVLKGG